jgi:hypothetical protein
MGSTFMQKRKYPLGEHFRKASDLLERETAPSPSSFVTRTTKGIVPDEATLRHQAFLLPETRVALDTVGLRASGVVIGGLL